MIENNVDLMSVAVFRDVKLVGCKIKDSLDVWHEIVNADSDWATETITLEFLNGDKKELNFRMKHTLDIPSYNYVRPNNKRFK